MPPHRLSQYCIHIRQRHPVFKVWQSLPPDHTVDFRLCTLLNLWVVHQEIDEDDKCAIGLKSMCYSMLPHYRTIKQTVSTEAEDIIRFEE